MAEFAYNIVKNASTSYIPFELNCGFHPRAFCKENLNPRSQSKSVNELATKLRELIAVCRENLQTHKSFKSNTTTSMQSLEAIPQARKFG